MNLALMLIAAGTIGWMCGVLANRETTNMIAALTGGMGGIFISYLAGLDLLQGEPSVLAVFIATLFSGVGILIANVLMRRVQGEHHHHARRRWIFRTHC